MEGPCEDMSKTEGRDESVPDHESFRPYLPDTFDLLPRNIRIALVEHIKNDKVLEKLSFFCAPWRRTFAVVRSCWYDDSELHSVLRGDEPHFGHKAAAFECGIPYEELERGPFVFGHFLKAPRAKKIVVTKEDTPKILNVHINFDLSRGCAGEDEVLETARLLLKYLPDDTPVVFSPREKCPNLKSARLRRFAEQKTRKLLMGELVRALSSGIPDLEGSPEKETAEVCSEVI